MFCSCLQEGAYLRLQRAEGEGQHHRVHEAAAPVPQSGEDYVPGHHEQYGQVLLGDPEVTANIYCKSRNLPNTDT